MFSENSALAIPFYLMKAGGSLSDYGTIRGSEVSVPFKLLRR